MGNTDEGMCYAHNVLRLTGRNHSSITNPDRRLVRIFEHEVGMDEDVLEIESAFGNRIRMDEEQYGLFSSGNIIVYGESCLFMYAQTIVMKSGDDCLFVQERSGSQINLIPYTGDVNFWANGYLHYEGLTRNALETFNNILEAVTTTRSGFDGWRVFANVVAAVAIITVGAALIGISGGLLAAVAIGALAFTTGLAYLDYRNDRISSLGTYLAVGLGGALTGAMLKPFITPVIAAWMLTMGPITLPKVRIGLAQLQLLGGWNISLPFLRPESIAIPIPLTIAPAVPLELPIAIDAMFQFFSGEGRPSGGSDNQTSGSGVQQVVNDNGELVEVDFDDLARQATNNADSDTVLLGKYWQDGVSYVEVATDLGTTFFQLENWDAIQNQIGQNNMWFINERFLHQQLQQGQSFLLSHNPHTATGFFAQEVQWLIEQGFRFIQEGNIWRAVR